MRLVIERGELLRALGHVTSVVERRTTIPILSNVLLRARDSKLEFKATDRQVDDDSFVITITSTGSTLDITYKRRK